MPRRHPKVHQVILSSRATGPLVFLYDALRQVQLEGSRRTTNHDTTIRQTPITDPDADRMVVEGGGGDPIHDQLHFFR